MDEERLKRHDLTDEEWSRLEPLLPVNAVLDGQRGLNGGPRAPACGRRTARACHGRSFKGDSEDHELVTGREALGRSRGGLSTKIHLVADRRCRPIARIITPGQHGDCPRFIPLLEAIRIPRRGVGRPRKRPARAMADKACSSRANRRYLRRRGIKAVIPVKKDQQAHRTKLGSKSGRPPAFDREAYKERNTVERCVNKLRQHRAVATRYDKRALIYQGTVDVASIRIWLRDPVM